MAVLLSAFSAAADDLPLALQVQLLQKTSAYITSLQPGEGGKVKVLVVYPGEKPSRASETVANTINQAGQLGRHPAEAKTAPLANLKATLAAEKPQMLWVSPEADDKGVTAVMEAVGSSNIVTVSAVAAHVRQGVILGFDVLEAKPRILVHLKQARAQSVVFLSGLLTHSVIVEK
ncbi:MAG: DUF4154 domain-containing protein [Myxococcaceae bacterium]|nr:DUF4154 domain-containing protein [Myxococcaceae bacterium]